MDISLVVFLVIGIGIGYLLGFFRFKNAKGSSDSEGLGEENIALKTELKLLHERINTSIEKFKEQEVKEDVLQSQNTELERKLASKESEFKNLAERLKEQKEELENLQEKFTKDFSLIANKILKSNSEEFSKSHKKELDTVLEPLKEKLVEFEKKVEDRYKENRDERMSLKHELKNLTKLNNELNLQAKNLTNALKGESKKQGNWGEMILERILESSGLIKGQEYETQYSDTNIDQKRIQPDVVIKLPDEKHIIVDAKVSLVAYERFVSSEVEEEKVGFLKEHILSVKTHVSQLSAKNYQTGIGVNSPDFVLLFIPIESSFSLAIQGDPDLYNFAWDKKVVIVSPTTLLATLRTIASVWKHEKQTKNAIEIADRAGKLYDKFTNFVGDLQKIEKGISQAQGAYDDAFNKLKDGKGNLIRQTQQIKELGAKTTKELPKELIDFDEES